MNSKAKKDPRAKLMTEINRCARQVRMLNHRRARIDARVRFLTAKIDRAQSELDGQMRFHL